MAVERDENELSIPDVLGILPLRGTVILPHAVIPLAVGRPGSVRLVQEALQGSRILGAVMQRDPAAEDPRAQDLHSIGTVILIHKALKQPDGTLRLVVQGLTRFRIGDVVQEAPFLRARIQRLTDETPATATLEVEALARTATGLFQKVVALSPTLPDELANILGAAEGPSALADLIAGSLPTLPTIVRQELLETISVAERLQRLVAALTKEVEVLELGSKIQSEAQSEMSKTQREYYLREQMKAIQKELGDADDRTQEIDALRDKIEAAGMTDEAEIRGHRRTYIGALPGQIIQGLRRAGTRNPVFMLDEIDKLGMDFRGDPASALLEVLDPEQNVSFRDHYLDVAFDLSRVLFVTSANVFDTVPPALCDRLWLIPLAGDRAVEKFAVAQHHLLSRETRDDWHDQGKRP